MGLVGAISIGVGGMVGGGIFAVLGEAVSLAEGAAPLAFLLAGIVSGLTAYCYSKLSVAFPSPGGTVTFIDRAYGKNLVSGTANLMLWLSYLVTMSLYATAFSSYASALFPQIGDSGLLDHVFVSAAILLPMVVNIVGTRMVGKMETVVVVIKLAILALVIGFGASSVDVSRLSVSTWSDPFPTFVAGMVIFVAYEGFELISNASAEIENPKRNLPLAYGMSVVGVVVLYIAIAILVVGAVPMEQIAQDKDYVLAVAAQPSLGEAGFVLVSVAALLATFSAINATIYANSRLGFILAKTGELPEVEERGRGGVPTDGIVSVAGVSLIIANVLPLEDMAIVASAGFLLVFILVDFAAARLSVEIHAFRFLTVVAGCVSVVAFFSLLWYSFLDSPVSLAVFIGFILLSFVLELTWGRLHRGHFLGRTYHARRSPD